jgi:hypothetical protein
VLPAPYKYFIKIFLLVLLFPLSTSAYEITDKSNKRISVPDSIMQNIFTYSPSYSKVVEGYKAEVYIKGLIDVHKKNIFLRYVPSMFRIENGTKKYIVESISDVQYSAPNIYERKIKAVSSTFKRSNGQFLNMLDLMKMNIYSSSMMSDKLLSPLDKDNSRHYKYILDSVYVDNNIKKYKISIQPKFSGTQLVNGYLVVSDSIWTIREAYFEGVYDMIHFKFKSVMGEEGSENELLPIYITIDGYFKFLGNNISLNCDTWIKYNYINFLKSSPKFVRRNKHHHDLSKSYRLTCDTSSIINDLGTMQKMRHVELSVKEDSIYMAYLDRKKRLGSNPKSEKKPNMLLSLGDLLISSYDINLSDLGSVRCSPLVNPMYFSYGHSNGYSYKQKFKYNKIFQNGKSIRIVPQIGYNFTRKEFYAKMDAEFQYLPKKQGTFGLSVGNGNRIYSSVVLDKLKELPDSIFDLSKIELDYFRDINLNLYHSIEPVNGLTIRTGVSMHWRGLINTSRLKLEKPISDSEWAKLRGISRVYNTFAPRITVEWTPGMYYYMNGNRKINIGSSLPTFSVDYERGIKNVFHANTSHERIEFDVQHKITLNGVRTIAYRVGGGIFTKQDDVYFVDFANFSRRNLPEGWNDDIGGTFQLLDGAWYNSSSQYWRGNISYESPFIILKSLSKICSKIQHERLYGGILFMPHLNPYMEFGYGIETNIFDVGIFVSTNKAKYDAVGMKFTFELFSK